MSKVLKFFSPTCGPCKVMSKLLDTLEGVEVKSIDITEEDNQELLDDWNVRTIPTIVVLDDNDKFIKKFSGIVTIDKIKEVLQ